MSDWSSDLCSSDLVEALVLHRPHVERRHRDDHEDVEVVLETVDLLVPAHRALQRLHGMAGAALVAAVDVDAQRHVAAGPGDEAVLDAAEVAGNQDRKSTRLNSSH